MLIARSDIRLGLLADGLKREILMRMSDTPHWRMAN
ncbi:hypothetical protein BRAS3843_430028 [Bradyrhizobium sp. STM 3843]|nr:hypothetical protein BRAS3843_430028 [Bradyrhizobium sp. STM 3843]